MQQQSGQLTVPALQARLQDGSLAGGWVLDPGRSTVRFKNRSLGGLLTVKGAFRDVSGHGTVFADGEVRGTLTIATGSLDTRNARRDRHLRSADFFDSDNSPEITFTTNGIRLSGERVTVTGALTIGGHTRPLSFDAEATLHGDGEVLLDAEVHVNRGDFDMTWNWAGVVAMDNIITVHAVFTQ